MSEGVFITGASGFIGSALTAALAAREPAATHYAFDLRPPPGPAARNLVQIQGDIRSPELSGHLQRLRPRVVVHLASVVAAGGDAARDFDIDVNGTRNVLEAARAAGVKRLVLTSSGAAYGYHADNPVPLTETDTLRGNDDFPYARHKRLVEEMLADFRAAAPELEQIIFRPCTVLGPGVANQITALFERPFVLGLTGRTPPFVFVSEADVVAALLRAVEPDAPPGIYNLAGDGTLSTREIAARIGRPHLAVPPWLLKALLGLLHGIGLSRVGAADVKFLQYRPVLCNRALKRDFGLRLQHTGSEAFDRYWQSREAGA